MHMRGMEYRLKFGQLVKLETIFDGQGDSVM